MIDQATYRNVKGWTNDKFGESSADEIAYFHAELTRSGVDPSRKLTILEFGFGNGGFALWCVSKGWNWTGVELDSELVDRAVASGLSAATSPPEMPSNTFDVIVGFDVFEHMSLEQLRSTLSYCGRALRQGGIVIGRVPSGDSPFSGWIYNGDLTHKLLLGSSAIRQLAAAANLAVVDIRSPSLPLSGLGLVKALRRLAVKAIQAPVSAAIRLGFHAGQSTVISPNLVFVLQRRS